MTRLPVSSAPSFNLGPLTEIDYVEIIESEEEPDDAPAADHPSAAGATQGGGDVSRFRKKPVVIEAVQWTGSNVDEIAKFVDPEWMRSVCINPPGDDLIVDTLEGEMRALPGDWLIRGVAGELYPCKPKIFAATYEPVPQTPAAVL